MKKRIINKLSNLYYWFLTKTEKVVRTQRADPFSTPILIINFNQLFYLRKQVDFYLTRGFKKIVILDNQSTYPPLLEYYKEIETKVTVEFIEENLGQLVFFKRKDLQQKYGQGYYVMTDADIVPNEQLPVDFMNILIKRLNKYSNRVTKVGFALSIDDVPDCFPHKKKVLEWESQFWKNEIEADCYLTKIDTTFALYKPQYPHRFNGIDFFSGLRIAGKFTAKHGGWYKDPQNLSREDEYYEQTATSVASWKLSNPKPQEW